MTPAVADRLVIDGVAL
jgi:hypothetical protein